MKYIYISVQFSHSVVFDSLWPHGLQHNQPHYPSPTPGVYSSSCPLSWWCHPTISSLVVPFSSHLQSSPASGSFPMTQLFASGSQSLGTATLASVLPMSVQGWFKIDWSDLLAVQGTLKSLLQHHSLKASILWHSDFFMNLLYYPPSGQKKRGRGSYSRWDAWAWAPTTQHRQGGLCLKPRELSETAS